MTIYDGGGRMVWEGRGGGGQHAGSRECWPGCM